MPNVVYRGEHISHISHTHLHQSTPSIQCRIFGTKAAPSVFICLYTWQDGVLNVVYREEHLSHVGDPAIYTSVSHTPSLIYSLYTMEKHTQGQPFWKVF